MNTQELIMKVIEFFFNNLLHFIGLIIFIEAIRGDITKTFQATSRFFKRVADKYRAKIEAQKIFNAERMKNRTQK